MQTATKTIKLPRLPAAARNAGATTIIRCSARSFAVGFKLREHDYDAPGHGAAVVNALRAWAPEGCTVTWGGRQADAIVLSFA